jgi:hypothetical protein
MTELSPQAQAVLDAVREICPAPANKVAAAALRAAARLEVSSNFDGTLYETGEDEFRAFLHVIAAALECSAVPEATYPTSEQLQRMFGGCNSIPDLVFGALPVTRDEARR